MKIERSEKWWLEKARAEANAVIPARWRHVKRGTTYTFLTIAFMQCSSNPEFDDLEVVVYQGDDGGIWTRPRAEFFDGRFEAIK